MQSAYIFSECCTKVVTLLHTGTFVFTAGIFAGQTFVLSSEVNHDLRPLIHQLVESGGGSLTAMGGDSSAADHHIVHPLLSSSVSESMDNLVTVCWLVSTN